MTVVSTTMVHYICFEASNRPVHDNKSTVVYFDGS